jgi:ribose-phosphate pyrophosphokinase
LGVPLTDTGITKFSNGEIRVKPSSEASATFRGKHVFIIQTGGGNVPTSVTEHVFEVTLMMDAVRRAGCSSITLIIPLYPYSRQDKKDVSKSPISAAVVATIWEKFGVDRVVTFDLHNACIQGFFHKACDNIFPTKVLREYLMNNVFGGIDSDYQKRFLLIAPDTGAAQKVEKVAGYLKLDFLTMSKARDYSTLNIHLTISLT